MTGVEIAECLGMALSTVSGVLTRIGMGKLSRIGLEPAQRYERARPGELIHIDVKKLGRIHNGAGHRFIGLISVISSPRRGWESGLSAEAAALVDPGGPCPIEPGSCRVRCRGPLWEGGVGARPDAV